jgi:hypothetical protein
MGMRKTAIAVALCATALTAFAVQTSVREATAAGKTPTLTADDYVDIQQLVARYSFALDTGTDNGYMYADLYAPDGVFMVSQHQTQGRDALAALARGGRRGPFNVRNLASPAIIKPSPEGATGIQYAQAINFGEAKQPTELDHFGHYEDVYVRTPDGWRFKSRHFLGESGALRPVPAAAIDGAAGTQSR